MKGSRSVLASLTWRTASARIRAVRSAAVAPSPNLSASQDKAPLKSAPVMCCTRSMAPPRPCWAMWSNHFPSFGPWARVMLNPSAFQRSGSALSCWKPRASKTSGSGNARILSAVAFCCTSAFGALTLPALLIGRRLGRLLGGAITRPCAHGRRTGRLVGRWPRPAHRPICRGSARRAAAPQSRA